VNLDRKNCENVLGKLEDLAYNAASFVWTPEVGAKVKEGRVRGGGGGTWRLALKAS
jgi:hypothetical protein